MYMYGRPQYGHYNPAFPSPSGIFFYLPNAVTPIPLPLLHVKAKATITSTNTHLQLTQSFRVPENTSIHTAKYSFPLYAHSAVSSFTAHIGPDKTLHAKIEKKEKAREQYDAAVASGRTAALMNEVSAEIFTMELGNLPANTEVKVVLGVIGELKGAGEDDTSGEHTLRYTLPMTIAPKYGSAPAELGWNGYTYGGKNGLEIDVEVLSPETIKGLSSPTHPISFGFGAQTEGGLMKMTASLAQAKTVELEKDFVLEVKLDKKSESVKPWAILEKHPTIPGQSATMVSFIPRLKLRKVKPEVIFVLDRSGSMAGAQIQSAVSAMQVFLRSLSAGVKFNVCSFGNKHEFMFRDGISRPYTEATMDEAMRYVSGITANMGGTELYSALKATLEARDKDSDTEVIVLTDGEIWQKEQVFDLIRAEKDKQAQNNKDFRLFAIGLGNGVDRHLVEGMANAGGGYAAFVGHNEAFEGKVVKMLKTALSERLLDMSFQLRDANGQTIDDEAEKDDDSDYTIIDEPTVTPRRSPRVAAQKRSLFNPDEDSDTEMDPSPATTKDAPLKPITPPNPLRAPYKVTTLLPGQRSIFYFLQAPTPLSKTREPKEVVFTAKTSNGDALELVIPVTQTPRSDNNDINTTIHKLAARRLIKEMEQGSTWIDDALSQQLNIQKKDAPSTYQRYVDQQGEAIAMKWQILSKWTSFIVVDEEGKKVEKEQDESVAQNSSSSGSGMSVFGAQASPASAAYGSRASSGLYASSAGVPERMTLSVGARKQSAGTRSAQPVARYTDARYNDTRQCESYIPRERFQSNAAPAFQGMMQLSGGIPSRSINFASASMNESCSIDMNESCSIDMDSDDEVDECVTVASVPVSAKIAPPKNRMRKCAAQSPSPPATLPTDPKALTLELLKHASFSGAFTLPTSIDLSTFHVTSSIAAILAQKGLAKPDAADDKEWIKFCDTILAVSILKEICASQEDVWDLVVSKAEGWVEEKAEEWGVEEKVLKNLWEFVGKVVKGEADVDVVM